MINVAEARTAQEREAVYALRYAVYVEEMGREQAHADHRRRVVEEPEDEVARLLIARTAKGDVVGTARVHLGSHVPHALGVMYGMQHFSPFYPTQTSAVTKLMVDRRFRQSPLAFRLAQACYDMGLNAGMSFNFIDCNAHLRPFFTQLGFRQVLPDFLHPSYGLVSPLVLALRDFQYLRQIRSPFAIPQVEDEHTSVEFFADLLQRASHLFRTA